MRNALVLTALGLSMLGMSGVSAAAEDTIKIGSSIRCRGRRLDRRRRPEDLLVPDRTDQCGRRVERQEARTFPLDNKGNPQDTLI